MVDSLLKYLNKYWPDKKIKTLTEDIILGYKKVKSSIIIITRSFIYYPWLPCIPCHYLYNGAIHYFY